MHEITCLFRAIYRERKGGDPTGIVFQICVLFIFLLKRLQIPESCPTPPARPPARMPRPHPQTGGPSSDSPGVEPQGVVAAEVVAGAGVKLVASARGARGALSLATQPVPARRQRARDTGGRPAGNTDPTRKQRQRTRGAPARGRRDAGGRQRGGPAAPLPSLQSFLRPRGDSTLPAGVDAAPSPLAPRPAIGGRKREAPPRPRGHRQRRGQARTEVPGSPVPSGRHERALRRDGTRGAERVRPRGRAGQGRAGPSGASPGAQSPGAGRSAGKEPHASPVRSRATATYPRSR